MCAGMLKSAGLAAREVPFEFSQWPGRFGIPLIAGWLLLAVLTIYVVARFTQDSVNAAGLGNFTMLAGLVFGHKRRQSATKKMAAYRTTSSNLEAARGNPRVWLVAHLDSKSQSIPMLVRIVSHVALIALLFIAIAAGFVTNFGWIESPHFGLLAGVAFFVALPSLLCFVGNKSPGALDNATGVAAVLLAARLVSPQKSFGVLITSGEELDLAGARAWAPPSADGGFALLPSKPMMINCDTVDDAGTFRCMYVSRPHKLGMAAEKAAKKLGLGLRMGKVIPGIITDSMAFEAAGLPSVTLSRGTLQTLARLHTSGDSPDRLTGSGAAAAALMLAQMVEELA